MGIGAAAAVLILVVPFWGRMHMQPPDMSSSLRVGLVQPNFSLDVKWSAEYSEHMLETQKWLTDVAAVQGAELVVWPESSLYGYLVEEIAEFAEIVRSNDIYLLTGSNHYEKPHRHDEAEAIYLNSAFLVSPEGKILGRYDKQHLAPFGEYVPLGKMFPFLDKIIPQVADFTPGVIDTLFEVKDRKFAALICFENSFPHFVRSAARRGADFLVQLTNDGWFGRTGQPDQDLAIAVFRAIENGMTLVRGTNTGISCFVDPWGRIKGVVGESWGETVFVRGISVETISTRPHPTVYRAYGDVWLLACLAIVVVAFVLCLRGRGAAKVIATDTTKGKTRESGT
jgi:apolipoprotein N-acyltransferase